MFELRTSDGNATLAKITKQRTTVGRDPSNDIVFDDPSVSGFHAIIFLENGELSLVDLGSTNGTQVKRKRVTGKVAIAEGDAITFGRIESAIGDPTRRRATVVMPRIRDEDLQPSPESGFRLRRILGEGPIEIRLQGQQTVGRNADNAIVLASSMVSGLHANLHLDQASVWIEDCDSTNGTYVNGQRVRRQQLVPGDRVRFDEIEYELVAQSKAAPTLQRDVDPRLRGATTLNPAVGADAIIAKADRLARELGMDPHDSPKPGTPATTIIPTDPTASKPPPAEPRAEAKSPSAPTVVQSTVGRHKIDVQISSSSDERREPTVGEATLIQPAVADSVPPDEDEPEFLRDKPLLEPSSHEILTTDDSIGALWGKVTTDFGQWIPAFGLIALGTVLLIGIAWGMGIRAVTQASSPTQLLAFNLAGMICHMIGYTALIATAAQQLGYPINSPTTVAMKRCIPWLATMIGFSIITLAGLFVALLPAALGRNIVTVLIAIVLFFGGIYASLRLWPALIIAVTESRAVAFGEAWRLTGRKGAWSRSTWPTIGWMLALAIPIFVVFAVIDSLLPPGLKGSVATNGLLGLVAALIAAPMASLIVVSRYMRLHKLASSY